MLVFPLTPAFPVFAKLSSYGIRPASSWVCSQSSRKAVSTALAEPGAGESSLASWGWWQALWLVQPRPESLLCILDLCYLFPVSLLPPKWPFVPYVVLHPSFFSHSSLFSLLVLHSQQALQLLGIMPLVWHQTLVLRAGSDFPPMKSDHNMGDNTDCKELHNLASLTAGSREPRPATSWPHLRYSVAGFPVRAA